MSLLSDKVAVVTGAGRGIGRAVALRLAGEGADVAVNDIDFDSARRTGEQIEALGRASLALQADVSKLGEVQGMFRKILTRFGRVDILVNNAGISPKKGGGKVPMAGIEEEEWDRVINVNLKGVFLCSQAVIESMKGQHFGRIINISSIVAKTGDTGPAGGHYAASKGGILSFTKALARELAPYGVTANAIAPGFIATELFEATDPEIEEFLRGQVPLGRFGTPEEVAELVAFLASDGVGYITGATIDINGGCFMG